MDIRVKRIYETPAAEDGQRILVDRLWPRGISKEKANIAYWAKDISPTNELRKWYGHDPENWSEFKSRYAAELDANPDGLESLLGYVRKERVTFLYSSKENRLNNAVALKEYVESRER